MQRRHERRGVDRRRVREPRDLTGPPLAGLRRGGTRGDGLLDLDPTQNALGWMILMAIGLASAFSMWLFNRWLEKQKA